MDIQRLRQMIRQESPSRLMEGTIISADPRGTRTASVRVSGGRVHTRVYTCDDALGVGDKVIVARLEGLGRLVIIGKIVSKHGSSLSKSGLLAPPNNFSVLAYPAMVYAQWDTYPGEDLSWEIQYSTAGSPYSDAAQVLVSRGSYYLHPCDPGTTIHMRARGIRWLGANNVMFSAWTSWSSVAAADHEVPNLIITLTNKSGDARVAGEVVIVDTGNADSFTTTVSEGDTGVVGVVMESIANGAAGLVCISGYCEVLVDEAVAIGEYMEASTTAGQAEGEAARASGTFARALTAAASPGDTVWAIVSLGMMAGGGAAPAPANEGEALVANAVPAWEADLTPLWLGTHTWGTGVNVMPTDETGQALGDATHRWDLHTQDVHFEGDTNNNTTTIPDNISIALKVLDSDGLEYLRINSEDANPYLLIDPAGTGIKVGIGTIGPTSLADVAGVLVVSKKAFVVPTGSGALEFSFRTDNIGYISCYDRTAVTYRPFRIDGSSIALMTGKVGIGTAVPVCDLDVRGAGAQTGIRVGYNSTASARGDLIAMSNSIRFNAYNDATPGYILLDFRGSPVTFSIGSSEKMRVHTNGYIGIGTTPQGLLHGHDSIGGFLYWEGSVAALESTSTIVPNGGGDITKGFMGLSVVVKGTATRQWAPQLDTPAAASVTFEIFTDGTDKVNLRLHSSGLLELHKSLGTSTVYVSVWLLWQ